MGKTGEIMATTITWDSSSYERERERKCVDLRKSQMLRRQSHDLRVSSLVRTRRLKDTSRYMDEFSFSYLWNSIRFQPFFCHFRAGRDSPTLDVYVILGSFMFSHCPHHRFRPKKNNIFISLPKTFKRCVSLILPLFTR